MLVNPLLRLLAILSIIFPVGAYAQDRPNILVIWGDDIGQSNISAYSMGLIGYRTPSIDRIAKEGMIFTDYYGGQSGTAGRSSYITGQSVYRTGLSRLGAPRSDQGMHEKDPTIAGLLKKQGYTTGQFGQNRLGDKDKHLPTNHGFDQFFGNLYQLNTEEEAENDDYPKDADFLKRFGPRGVIRSSADGEILNTGPLTKKRMETIDEETLATAIDFIERANAAGTPFYVWWNGTRMHFRTHVKEESRGLSGQDEYADGMVEHDMHVGKLLDVLDRLGIADNTIVHYSTDNGPNLSSWPDGGMTPFFGQKNTNWEGGRRVPSMVRWPGKIPPGSVSNEIMHHLDWLPTYLAVAGDAGIKERLKKGGVRAIGRRYKAHLDGYNFLPYLLGKTEEGPRHEIFYFAETGELTALRYDDWKVVLLRQRPHEDLNFQTQHWTELQMPLLFNLRSDPYELSNRTAIAYSDWAADRAHVFLPMHGLVAQFSKTLKVFRPRRKPAGFSFDQVMEKLRATDTSE